MSVLLKAKQLVKEIGLEATIRHYEERIENICRMPYSLEQKHLIWAYEFAISVLIDPSKEFPKICYKSNEVCMHDCDGLCKESC